uniref:Spermidine synthase n=1 Tax=Cyanothece sp. (strain PCC 7425 / ATCC 29141) TaxID=395961 RepID=B8HLW4_CYAP4
MLILFALTLFVSAFLLFWVQLMVAKMILPLLGGSPAVWNTCLCFFQAVLLLGYAYANLLTEKLKVRAQILMHGLVLLLPLPLLPIALRQDWLPLSPAMPLLWLLMLLLVSVGLPFFVVATSAPLLQRWFAQLDHPASDDPYFLYSASNLGSMLGLLSYPLLIEPGIALTQQRDSWAIGYLVLTGLILGCGYCLWRFPGKLSSLEPSSEVVPLQEPPTLLDQGRWLVLAFLPSSLLLGVTTYLTTDIAAIPLFWAVPLAIYLLTFILAFARQPPFSHRRLLAGLPLLLTALVLFLLLKVVRPAILILPLHLVGLFAVAYLFHGELAERRPSPRYLTQFYLWIAVGGVVGGMFNAIAAPLLFSTVLEYPLVLVLSLLLLPCLNRETSPSGLRLTLPLSLGLLFGGLLIGFSGGNWSHGLELLVSLALMAAIVPIFQLKPLVWITGGVLLLLLNQFSISSLGGILTTQRSFFGIYQVLQEQRTNLHTLLHGTTVHGMQSFEPGRQREPLTYFSPRGPIGQVFTALAAPSSGTKVAPTPPARVAVLGLGVGTLIAYAQPGQTWTFYEIDPVVETLASDRRYFTFLADAPVSAQILRGDARLRLQEATEQSYDLIVMDAFSSDAIPVHLITREAMQLYLHKLSQQGLIAVNITNRFLKLEPVLAALAMDLNLTALHQYDRLPTSAEETNAQSSSHWVIFARNAEDLAGLDTDPRWQPLTPQPGVYLWTDEYSNLLQILRP